MTEMNENRYTVAIGCDLYNGNLTGGVLCNMNANSNASANHAGPSVMIVEYCGDRSDPSVSTEKSYCIPPDPVNDRQQAVCVPLTNRGVVPEGGCSASRGMWLTETPLRTDVVGQKDTPTR